jgi:hypothetical protein
MVGGQRYWFAPANADTRTARSAFLLPNYDEYTVAYKERHLFCEPDATWSSSPRANVPFAHVIVLDGRVVGGWTRSPSGALLSLDWRPDTPASERSRLEEAVQRHAAFYQARGAERSIKI